MMQSSAAEPLSKSLQRGHGTVAGVSAAPLSTAHFEKNPKQYGAVLFYRMLCF